MASSSWSGAAGPRNRSPSRRPGPPEGWPSAPPLASYLSSCSRGLSSEPSRRSASDAACRRKPRDFLRYSCCAHILPSKDQPFYERASEGRRARGERSFHGGSKGWPRVWSRGRYRRCTSTEAAAVRASLPQGTTGPLRRDPAEPSSSPQGTTGPRSSGPAVTSSSPQGTTGPRDHGLAGPSLAPCEYGEPVAWANQLWQQHKATGWWQRMPTGTSGTRRDRSTGEPGDARAAVDEMRQEIAMLRQEVAMGFARLQSQQPPPPAAVPTAWAPTAAPTYPAWAPPPPPGPPPFPQEEPTQPPRGPYSIRPDPVRSAGPKGLPQ
jgi:hypothetical protein